MQLGIPEWQARAVNYCRKAYWHMAKNGHVQRALSKERLAQTGYYRILDRYARWCERTGLNAPPTRLEIL